MNNTFKLLAKQAKQRLKSDCIKVLVHRKKYILSEDEEIFYRKVCGVLSQEKVVCNSLGSVLDFTKYNSLDNISQQRYLFEIIEKFNECKERYEKEFKQPQERVFANG